MQYSANTAPAEPVKAPPHGFGLLVEPEPWLRSFLHNLGDLFRPDPPQVWMTATPGEYWPDALVQRPVAWARMIQSYLLHAVVIACVYAGNLFWLNQPHVISEEPPQTATILRYPLSEYLPQVSPQPSRSEVPLRPRAQKADPEYSAQRIVSLNVDHTSTRQTIVQPDLKLLQHDVPMPNIVAQTTLPMPPLAMRRPGLDFPSPVVAPPAEGAIERTVSRLTFPVPAQPQVIAPSSPVTANLQAEQIVALPGPVVIPPAEETARRDPSRLQLLAQAPPQVAAPSSPAVARSNFAILTPVQPEVVAPAQAAAQHRLAAIGLPAQTQVPAVAPPSPPVTGGMSRVQSQETGRLLALNVQPAPPNEAMRVPEGNRKGEFAAGPEGHAGASGAPETRQGHPSRAENSGGGRGPSGISVDPPPVKIAGNAAVSAPRLPAPAATNAGKAASADTTPADRIDNEIFGSRRRYSMHLNMPNLNSAMGSWTVRFAELNADPAERGDLTAPEAIRKVDPAYPANLIKEEIEGVVVLHAVIRADGSVGDVRVLEGFYQELDENARAALEQWRFRPGTKNGVPVDVEAVIRVPFRVSKFRF